MQGSVLVEVGQCKCMNDIVSPIYMTYCPPGVSKVGRMVAASRVPSWFPGGLAFEMDWKDGRD